MNVTTTIDPIETVSSYCGMQSGTLIDEPDVYGRTPLHYAAQKGSMISSIYLINRKVDINAKDIDGNTPLGIALLAGHQSYTVILMQNECNVRDSVYKIDICKNRTDKIKARKDRLKWKLYKVKPEWMDESQDEIMESEEVPTGHELYEPLSGEPEQEEEAVEDEEEIMKKKAEEEDEKQKKE